MAAIVCRDLTRDFGSLRAVDRFSFEVKAGSVFTLLGANGAGKTTTVHLLLGILEPTSGSAEVLGIDCASRGGEVRARSGALLEHAGLYERLNAEDNLDFYARIARMDAPARRSRIEELLRHFELWDRRSEPVVRWSRGMKQKLAIARVMLHRPAVIFFDEPTAGLDPASAASLREDIAQLVAEEKVTVFLNTHNLLDAERLSDQVAIVRQGKILTIGSLDEISSSEGIEVEVTGSGIDESAMSWLRQADDVAAATAGQEGITIRLRRDRSIAALISGLVERGAAIEEVRKQRPSLEETFLELMGKPRE